MVEKSDEKYFCPFNKEHELIREVYGPYVSYNCLACGRGFGDVSRKGFQLDINSGLSLGELPHDKKDLAKILKKLEKED